MQLFTVVSPSPSLLLKDVFLATKCTHILIIKLFFEFLESRYRDSNSHYLLLVDYWGGFEPDGSMGPFLHVFPVPAWGLLGASHSMLM